MQSVHFVDDDAADDDVDDEEEEVWLDGKFAISKNSSNL